MRSAWLAAAFAALSFAPLPASGADAPQDPQAVVKTMVDGVLDVLAHRSDPKRLTEAEREKIRQIVYPYIDFRRMAKHALGKTWRKISEDERAHFTKLFRELIEYTYGNRLSEYHGQKVRFLPAEFKKNKARVRSFVVEPDKEIPIEYRLYRTKSGKWMIYDVRVEGASLVRTFRQDFQSILSQKGYAGLVKELEAKVARLKEQR